MRLSDAETLTESLLKTAGARFRLLLLLRKGEDYLSALADKLELPLSQLSGWTDDLVEAGLAEEFTKPGEGRKRYVRLSKRGADLLDAVSLIVGPPAPPGPANRDLVLAYLEATNPVHNAETRKDLAISLANLAREKVIEVYPEVRGAFVSLAKAPSTSDAEKPLWLALETCLRRIARDPGLRKWAVDTLLPELLTGAQNHALPLNARERCLSVLHSLFREVEEKREDILNVAMKIWFKDGAGKDSHRAHARAIVVAAYRSEETVRAPLLHCLLKDSKSEDHEVKKKASDLLSFLLAHPH